MSIYIPTNYVSSNYVPANYVPSNYDHSKGNITSCPQIEGFTSIIMSSDMKFKPSKPRFELSKETKKCIGKITSEKILEFEKSQKILEFLKLIDSDSDFNFFYDDMDEFIKYHLMRPEFGPEIRTCLKMSPMITSNSNFMAIIEKRDRLEMKPKEIVSPPVSQENIIPQVSTENITVPATINTESEDNISRTTIYLTIGILIALMVITIVYLLTKSNDE
jgi:hypothetical protein